jgi:hypothetical protein
MTEGCLNLLMRRQIIQSLPVRAESSNSAIQGPERYFLVPGWIT